MNAAAPVWKVALRASVRAFLAAEAARTGAQWKKDLPAAFACHLWMQTLREALAGQAAETVATGARWIAALKCVAAVLAARRNHATAHRFPPILFTAACSASGLRWAYRCELARLLCPSTAPTSSSVPPALTISLAVLWRRSWK